MSTEAQYVGNQMTETIIGLAHQKMASSLKQYEAAMQQVQKLPEVINEYTAQIVQAERKLKDLNDQFNEKVRQFNVELELSKKQSVEKIANEYLNSQSSLMVKASEWTKVQEELKKALTDVDAAVKKEVAIVTNSLTKQHESALKIREAEYNAKEAENRATINSLNSQLRASQEEVARWKNELAEERKASVERSKANAIGAVNLQAPGK